MTCSVPALHCKINKTCPVLCAQDVIFSFCCEDRKMYRVSFFFIQVLYQSLKFWYFDNCSYTRGVNQCLYTRLAAVFNFMRSHTAPACCKISTHTSTHIRLLRFNSILSMFMWEGLINPVCASLQENIMGLGGWVNMRQSSDCVWEKEKTETAIMSCFVILSYYDLQ